MCIPLDLSLFYCLDPLSIRTCGWFSCDSTSSCTVLFRSAVTEFDSNIVCQHLFARLVPLGSSKPQSSPDPSSHVSSKIRSQSCWINRAISRQTALHDQTGTIAIEFFVCFLQGRQSSSGSCHLSPQSHRSRNLRIPSQQCESHRERQ